MKHFFQYFWRHFRWEVPPAPDADLSGRYAIVTGSNTGLGYEAALGLMKRKLSHLIIAVRNVEKGETARKAMLEACPGVYCKIEVWQLDMASFASVNTFGERLNSLPRLDIFIANAGIYTRSWCTTNDGYEESLQVNAISTGLLCLIAVPPMNRTAKLPGQQSKPHLVVVASETHDYPAFKVANKEGSIIEALNDKANHVPSERYYETKLIDVYIARELAKLKSTQALNVNSVTAGLCKTGIFREWSSGDRLSAQVGWTAEKGARNYLFAALADTTPGAFIHYGKEMEPSQDLVLSQHGQKTQKRVWDELCGIWRQQSSSAGAVLI